MGNTPLNLEALILKAGKHESDEGEVCFIEAAAVVDGLDFSDRPVEYCPVLSAFGRRWNDDLDELGRQTLKRFLDDGHGKSRLLGTGGDGFAEQRAWMCADWLVRVQTPAWLELASVTESAVALRGLTPLTSSATARAATPSLHAAGAAARDAARDAAWDAARDAAWDAARDAAWAAARDAAWAAARDAARAAAWAAAGVAAGVAAGAAAGVAARDAAWDAARDAARAAAWDAAGGAARDAARDAARAAAGDAAGGAARDAAWVALEPTVVSLQTSALELMDAMLSLGNKS
jgi:hypothetical protein